MARRHTSTPARPAKEPDVLDRTATLRLFVVMARALRAVTASLREHLKQFDLSPTEFGVLEALYHKGPLPPSRLADLLLVTGASTTYTVKGLERRGLLRRRGCEDDQRVVFAELTTKGRALIARVFPLHAQQMRRAMQGLTTREKREAAALLVRLGRGARGPDGDWTS